MLCHVGGCGGRREIEVEPGAQALTEAVARALFKLMSYKDEYEMARLFSDGTWSPI